MRFEYVFAATIITLLLIIIAGLLHKLNTLSKRVDLIGSTCLHLVESVQQLQDTDAQLGELFKMFSAETVDENK